MKKILVPILKQPSKACGPTSLAMVLKYFKYDISIQEIIQNIGGLKSYGVKVTNLATFAEKLGYRTHCFTYSKSLSKNKAIFKKPSKKLLLYYLKKRLPVIIAVRTYLLNNLKPSKSGHIIVITNYSAGSFWFNDPNDGRRRRINEDDLLFSWFNNVLDSSAYMLVLEPQRNSAQDNIT